MPKEILSGAPFPLRVRTARELERLARSVQVADSQSDHQARARANRFTREPRQPRRS